MSKESYTDIKYVFGDMFKKVIPLIDATLETYDLEWTSEFYNVPNLKERLIQLKKDMQLYIYKYIEEEHDFYQSVEATNYITNKGNYTNKHILYKTIESEIYRQMKETERRILKELIELSKFLGV